MSKSKRGSRIARDYPNADDSPRKVGQTIRVGSQDLTIVGLFDTGSILIDATIVMDIGVARKLLGLGPYAVSTYNVEPANLAESDTLAERMLAFTTGSPPTSVATATSVARQLQK